MLHMCIWWWDNKRISEGADVRRNTFIFQIQQQLIQQQQQQLHQLQQQQLQQQLQQFQQQALQRQHHAIQQHLKNQQDQELVTDLLYFSYYMERSDGLDSQN